MEEQKILQRLLAIEAELLAERAALAAERKQFDADRAAHEERKTKLERAIEATRAA